MRNQRTAHRWRLMLALFVFALLALGSFWMVQLMDQGGAGAAADPHANEPDYFVDNFSVVRMSPAGQPSSIVSGTHLVHRPLDDSSEISLPFVRSLQPELPPTDMHAAHARVDQHNSRIQLSGDVRIDRAATPGAQSLSLRAPTLTVFPDADRMETDQAFEMRTGTTLLTGLGMRADNASGRVEVQRRVHILYPPAPR